MEALDAQLGVRVVSRWKLRPVAGAPGSEEAGSGGGRYSHLMADLMRKTGAKSIVLLVLDGKKGPGLTSTVHDPKDVRMVGEILMQMGAEMMAGGLGDGVRIDPMTPDPDVQ